MAIPVSFAGVAYSIPQRGDTGWFTLTDYLVALSQAQTRSQTAFNVRNVANVNTSVSSTDTFIIVTAASAAVTVTLPAASTNSGRLIGVAIDSGTNSVTIAPAGSDAIAGLAASASLVMTGAKRAIYLFADGAVWQILSSVGSLVPALGMVQSNPTNQGVSSSFAEPYFTGAPAAANLQSMTVTLSPSRNPYSLIVNASSTEQVIVQTSFVTAAVNATYDPSGLFLPANAGSGIVVTKSASSNVVTIRNRLGGSRNFQITATTALISSATAWS